MGNVKGQGTGADTVRSLAMPLKLIENGKFREAELIIEQYVRSNPEDGVAYLAWFSAKVNSLTLPTFQAGSDWRTGEREDNLALYAEYHDIFAKFIEFASNAETVNALVFMKKYFECQLDTIASLRLSKGQREKVVALFDTVLGASASVGMEFYSEIALVMGNCLLRLSLFKEARGFFEEVTGARKSESLLRILFCALEVVNEEQFARSKRFSVEMPEYIKLLVSLEEDDTLYEEITQLIERNPKGKKIEPKPVKKPQSKGAKKVGAKKGASKSGKGAASKSASVKGVGKKQAPPVKAKISLTDIRAAYEKRSGSPLSILALVLFWIAFTGAFVYLIFFYREGAIWNAFIQFTPFGRPLEREESQVSIKISTAVIILLQAAIIVVVIFCRYKLIQRIKVYSICTPIIFALWYIGYVISQLPAYNVMTASVVTCCFFFPSVAGVVAMLLGGFQFHRVLTSMKDVKFDSFRGEFFKKMYEKGLIAIPLLSSAVYMILGGMTSWYEILIFVAVLAGGGAIAFIAFKNRLMALFGDITFEMTELKERQKMAFMEWLTGLILLGANVVFVGLCLLCKVEFSTYIGLVSVASLFGLSMLVSGIGMEYKLYHK